MRREEARLYLYPRGAIKRGGARDTYTETMYFRLGLTSDFHSIFGAVGKNGKLYFSAVDIGLVLRRSNILGWAEKVASCKLGEISPGCDSLLENDWMIEYNGLLNILAIQLSMASKTKFQKHLYHVLEFGYVRRVGELNNVLQLEECCSKNGQLFTSLMLEWKEDTLQTPPWMSRLGLEN